MATYILTLGALLPYPGQEHDDPKPCHAIMAVSPGGSDRWLVSPLLLLSLGLLPLWVTWTGWVRKVQRRTAGGKKAVGKEKRFPFGSVLFCFEAGSCIAQAGLKFII